MPDNMLGENPLKFIVAPHIVQDLGLNLYTDLPRVLVEFVANAYDADSRTVEISMDIDLIDKHRKLLKKQWEAKKEEALINGISTKRLAELTLPDDITIVITDYGCGMSRTDLQNKFLIAGRRRREADDKDYRTANGRILMGRKGLGKLAGFGVAQTITIISRAKGEKHATKIVLDYNEIIKVKNTNEIPIAEGIIEDGGDIPDSGTVVMLSKLLYDPMKSRLETVENRVAGHFYQISPEDFTIKLNNKMIEPTKRTFAYAWPQPDKPLDELIDEPYLTDDESTFAFKYRLRFTKDREALNAMDRGIRVYSHKRLVAAPSLLEADTNMHGFRMTDYLDGVVVADFIDDQPEDYIATDRQTLRWESPFLQPMYKILSDAIKEACYNRQKKRDEESKNAVREDEFTLKEIGSAELTKKETEAMFKIAATLSSLYKKGVEDEEYQTTFKQVIHGFGQGEILTTLFRLAKDENPAFDKVVVEVTRLTAEELDGFFRFAKGRINAIEALKKIVLGVDFKGKKNEDQLHELLNKNPWLIDPTFFEFLTSDRSEKTIFFQLEKALKIGNRVDKKYDKDAYDETNPGGKNLRPDLVFLLGNEPLNRLVIVELKAPNTPLYGEHYRQLEKYIRDTNKWLKINGKSQVDVQGILIGSLASINSQANDVEWLRETMIKTRNQGECRVFSIYQLLENAELVHKELLERQKLNG